MLDINVAVRGLNLTDNQKTIFDNAIAKTKSLPDVTSGTKEKFKEAISSALNNKHATFIDLITAPLAHYEGRLNDTVMGHYEIALRWAEFDESLNDEQRLTFRKRIGPTVTKVYRAMTSGSMRLTTLENLGADDYARKLNYTTAQQSKIVDLIKETEVRISILNDKGKSSTELINKTLTNPSLGFIEIPNAMLDFYKSVTNVISIKKNYISDVHENLNEEQRLQLRDIIKGKLRMLTLIL